MEKGASKTQPVLHVYVYVCMYVCIYIYIDKAIRVIYIHMYTHKITYIYIYRERGRVLHKSTAEGPFQGFPAQAETGHAACRCLRWLEGSLRGSFQVSYWGLGLRV